MSKLHLHHIAAPGGKGRGAAIKIELPAAQEGISVTQPGDALALCLHAFGPDAAGAGVILPEGMVARHAQPGVAGQ